jgi:hypothetical protein
MLGICDEISQQYTRYTFTNVYQLCLYFYRDKYVHDDWFIFIGVAAKFTMGINNIVGSQTQYFLFSFAHEGLI